jgi:hypothetical protein
MTTADLTLTQLDAPARQAVFARVRRFAISVKALGENGLDTQSATLVQPAILVALSNLAGTTNAFMMAPNKASELNCLVEMERALREISDLQLEADRQLRESAVE